MFITLTNKLNKKFLLNTDFIIEVEQQDDKKHSSLIFTINNSYPVKETLSEITSLINKN